MSKERKNILEWIEICTFLRNIYSFCSYKSVCSQLVAFVREHMWHKAMWMGKSMRLELTRVHEQNVFQAFYGFV